MQEYEGIKIGDKIPAGSHAHIYTVTGFSARAKKYPVIAECNAPGAMKQRKFSLRYARTMKLSERRDETE